ncbi:hypothetical protein V8E54_006283 [Elaphomyces granulatus]
MYHTWDAFGTTQDPDVASYSSKKFTQSNFPALREAIASSNRTVHDADVLTDALIHTCVNGANHSDLRSAALSFAHVLSLKQRSAGTPQFPNDLSLDIIGEILTQSGAAERMKVEILAQVRFRHKATFANQILDYVEVRFTFTESPSSKILEFHRFLF